MIGKVIFNLLSNNAALTAIVPAAKITPFKRLQKESLPAITYEVVDHLPQLTKDGVSKLDSIRISINVWTNTYIQASDLAKKIRTILDRYAGVNSGLNVDKIIFESIAELYEDDGEVYHHVVDFKIRMKY